VRAADAEYAFFLAGVGFLAVVARAGVFCVEVCGRASATGADIAITATAAKDTAIFLKLVSFGIET
jgi:hypothetical protein